jgi:hypothetical protein
MNTPLVVIDQIKNTGLVWSIKVTCPYCKKQHKHGGGLSNQTPFFGTRSADCQKGEYQLVISRPHSA